MRRLLLVIVLALPLTASAQEWTLYYTDTNVVNSDGSVTITPTVSLSGDADIAAYLTVSKAGTHLPLC